MANLLNQNVVDYPDTTGNGEQNATASHAGSSERQQFSFKPVELHSIEMVAALRAKLQRSHVARMKQRALPFTDLPKMSRHRYCI